jgi:hypothetical protein
MAKRIRRTQNDERDQKRRRRTKSMAAELADGQTGLAAPSELPGGPIVAARDGTIPAQAARLGDPRLQTVQRQALAAQIGRVQGNRHLQRVVVSLKQDGNVANPMFAHQRAPEGQMIQRDIDVSIAKPSIQRAVTFDACTAKQQKKILNAHRRARFMMNTAMKKLDRYTGKRPVDVRRALKRHFHSPSTFVARVVARNLRRVRASATSPQYECQSVQVGRRLAWAMWCVPFSDIEIYPSWFAESVDRRAMTLIHEWFHRYACKFDLGYEWEEGYGRHGALRSLLNADTFAHFVYDVR